MEDVCTRTLQNANFKLSLKYFLYFGDKGKRIFPAVSHKNSKKDCSNPDILYCLCRFRNAVVNAYNTVGVHYQFYGLS